MKTFRLKTINVVRKGQFPLQNNEKIDVCSAFKELKNEFDVKYDEEINFNQLTIRIEGISYNIFSNGKVAVYGIESLDKQEQILWEFFSNHLKKFVKKV